MNKLALHLSLLILAGSLLSGCASTSASNGATKPANNFIQQELEAEPAFLYMMEEEETASSLEDQTVLDNHEYTDQNVQQVQLEQQYKQAQ